VRFVWDQNCDGKLYSSGTSRSVELIHNSWLRRSFEMSRCSGMRRSFKLQTGGS